jgi:hypothetical protein
VSLICFGGVIGAIRRRFPALPLNGFARLKRLIVIQVWRTPTGLLAFVRMVPLLIMCKTHDLGIISEELWHRCCVEWCSIRKYNFRSKAEWQRHLKTRFLPAPRVVRWPTEVYDTCTHHLYFFLYARKSRVPCVSCALLVYVLQPLQECLAQSGKWLDSERVQQTARNKRPGKENSKI